MKIPPTHLPHPLIPCQQVPIDLILLSSDLLVYFMNMFSLVNNVLYHLNNL